MTQVDQVLIRCELGNKGMFPTELVVRIAASDGTTVSMLADDSLIERRDAGNYLRATRLGIEPDGTSLCLLPTEETDTGTRWVRVRTADLRQAA